MQIRWKKTESPKPSQAAAVSRHRSDNAKAQRQISGDF
jgi:hypothetical protein